MRRTIPFVPTLLVLAAVATMIALGIWQIGRAREKEALLGRLAAARDLPPIDLTSSPPSDAELPLFRRARANCVPGSRRTVAGRSVADETGYVHVVRCRAAPGRWELSVAIGWSKDPNAAFRWNGGDVQGLLAPDSQTGMRIVAEQPAPGLQAVEPPSLESIPNNHRSYVVTWFLFAALALLIYILALRARTRDARR
jgi:surfeit locus 1 family protein